MTHNPLRPLCLNRGTIHAMKTSRLIASIILSVFVSFGAYVYFNSAKQAAPASEFVLLDGSTTHTKAFEGKVTLVNFWATSCTTCVAEMPDIVATYNKYQNQGFDTVAVAMQYDPPQYVLNYAQSRQLPFKVALDNTGAVAKAWAISKSRPPLTWSISVAKSSKPMWERPIFPSCTS